MTETNFKIQVTESAIQKIMSTSKKYMNDNYTIPVFRLSVVNIGCGGMSYKYDVDKENTAIIADEELCHIQNGIKVIIQKSAFDILNGVTLDYVDELIGSHFEINNPNAKANCGCGKSFSMRERKIQKDKKNCIV